MQTFRTSPSRLALPALAALGLALAAGCAAPSRRVAERSYAIDPATPATLPGVLEADPAGRTGPSLAAPSDALTADALVHETLTTPSTSARLVQGRGGSRMPRPPRWRERQTVLQGFLGLTLIDSLERTGGSSPDVDGSDTDQLPLIGGGAQIKLGGERIDWGVEGLLAFNWRANGGAFVAGGGGATVAVSIDLLLLELYGGPFASVFLGDDWRLYGALGPTVSFGSYDQEGSGVDDSGSGFGVGGYARTGLEYRWSESTMVGLGARYFDETIDLSGGLGDLELSGTQFYLSVTQGF